MPSAPRCFGAGCALRGAACSVAGRRARGPPPPPVPAVHILGAAQDAGVPQVLCSCRHCRTARTARLPGHRVTALGIRGRSGRWWLVDATPDFREQVESMGGLPAGILLTHAHMGHLAGLLQLGREVLDTRGLPVYCSPAMARLLREEAPWSLLVRLGEIELRSFRSGEPFLLEPGLEVTPIRVPHRDEFADTHAFRFAATGGGSLLYLPDIDRWEAWDRDLRALARENAWLLLDGTFFTAGELPGRDLAEIPHPPVVHTMDLLQEEIDAGRCRVLFTHLNHSNPLWEEGPARRELRRRGFGTALERDRIPLAAALE